LAIEHKDIPDDARHEPKGASTASLGQVLRSNGGGSTSFVNPSSLNNITVTSFLENQSTVTQNPGAVDTPLVVSFGPLIESSDIRIGMGGVVTLKTTGLYFITFNLSLGRANNTGVSTMFVRILINDVPTDIVRAIKIDTSANITPVTIPLFRRFTADDTVKVEILRDSSGANDGGVISLNPVLAGWADSPAASVKVQKITGGF
jgi:hypothetical protein